MTSTFIKREEFIADARAALASFNAPRPEFTFPTEPMTIKDARVLLADEAHAAVKKRLEQLSQRYAHVARIYAGGLFGADWDEWGSYDVYRCFVPTRDYDRAVEGIDRMTYVEIEFGIQVSVVGLFENVDTSQRAKVRVSNEMKEALRILATHDAENEAFLRWERRYRPDANEIKELQAYVELLESISTVAVEVPERFVDVVDNYKITVA